MYKANLSIIISLGVLVLSFLFFYSSYLKNTDNFFLKYNYSYRGVKLIPENAPALSNLFMSGKKDAHNVFTSASECLKCHSLGMKIDGKTHAPQIAHNVLDYCVSCHVLAKDEK